MTHNFNKMFSNILYYVKIILVLNYWSKNGEIYFPERIFQLIQLTVQLYRYVKSCPYVYGLYAR